jgi:hypothetical protein
MNLSSTRSTHLLSCAILEAGIGCAWSVSLTLQHSISTTRILKTHFPVPLILCFVVGAGRFYASTRAFVIFTLPSIHSPLLLLTKHLLDQHPKRYHPLLLFIPIFPVSQPLQHLHTIRISLLLRPPTLSIIIKPTPSSPSPPSSHAAPSKPSSPHPASLRFLFRVGLDGCGVDALERGEQRGICFEEVLKFGVGGESGEVCLLLEVTRDWRRCRWLWERW